MKAKDLKLGDVLQNIKNGYKLKVIDILVKFNHHPYGCETLLSFEYISGFYKGRKCMGLSTSNINAWIDLYEKKVLDFNKIP